MKIENQDSVLVGVGALASGMETGAFKLLASAFM
jgi:hypothetical protein